MSSALMIDTQNMTKLRDTDQDAISGAPRGSGQLLPARYYLPPTAGTTCPQPQVLPAPNRR